MWRIKICEYQKCRSLGNVLSLNCALNRFYLLVKDFIEVTPKLAQSKYLLAIPRLHLVLPYTYNNIHRINGSKELKTELFNTANITSGNSCIIATRNCNKIPFLHIVINTLRTLATNRKPKCRFEKHICQLDRNKECCKIWTKSEEVQDYLCYNNKHEEPVKKVTI